MLLERTIFQLDVGDVPPERARALGQMGFMQWLGALPGDASYLVAASQAYERAAPFRHNSPAVSVFCDLLLASSEPPYRPLDLQVLPPARKGGARARRLSL